MSTDFDITNYYTADGLNINDLGKDLCYISTEQAVDIVRSIGGEQQYLIYSIKIRCNRYINYIRKYTIQLNLLAYSNIEDIDIERLVRDLGNDSKVVKKYIFRLHASFKLLRELNVDISGEVYNKVEDYFYINWYIVEEPINSFSALIS